MQRNLSIDQHFNAIAARHKPQYRFAGKTPADWKRWRAALHPAVLKTLGTRPTKVPLRPEILCEWREDGLIKQRLVIDVEAGLSATGLVFRPENAKGKLPAILCCHGHGPYGKESVMGNRSSPEMKKTIENHNYDYGLQMAKAGFVTMAIDWRGFGERDDRRKPINHDISMGRDLCNVHYLRTSILGTTMLSGNVHDGQCALDYLCRHSFVDPKRIGVMGLSFGGTMTTWMSICDPRIKATDIICYSDVFADFGMRDTNFCGNQISPGLYALCDLPDLQGLTSPRPLLVEIGVHDDCFLIDSAMKCYRAVEKIYQAAGLRDRLVLDLFEGGHGWGANKSVEFFRKNL